jgi:hypothetical protein
MRTGKGAGACAGTKAEIRTQTEKLAFGPEKIRIDHRKGFPLSTQVPGPEEAVIRMDRIQISPEIGDRPDFPVSPGRTEEPPVVSPILRAESITNGGRGYLSGTG